MANSGWVHVELKPEGEAEVDQNPYDGTFLISWRKPSYVGIVVTREQLQDLLARSMVAQISAEAELPAD